MRGGIVRDYGGVERGEEGLDGGRVEAGGLLGKRRPTTLPVLRAPGGDRTKLHPKTRRFGCPAPRSDG